MQRLGLKVLALPLASFQDLLSATLILGQSLGQEAKAQKLCQNWQNQAQELKSRFQGEPITVFFEIRAKPLVGAGQKSITNEIITCAGGENVIKTEQKLVHLSPEALLALDPEAYIIQEGPMNLRPEKPEQRRGFPKLCALKKQNVLVVSEALFSRPGPRALLACEKLGLWLKSLKKPENQKF